MQGIFRKENTDKALKYGIYRHLPTYEKIIRNLVSFFIKKIQYFQYNLHIHLNHNNSFYHRITFQIFYKFIYFH